MKKEDVQLNDLESRVTTLENSSFGPNPNVNPLTIQNLKNYITTSSSSVTQLTAGSNITLTPSTGVGVVQIAASGGGSTVSSVSGTGAGINVAPTTGAVVVSNTGVTSIVAGANISISGGTGAVTINAGGGTGSGIKFGGTGTDGALNVTSGTTTVSLGNLPVFIKNYSSMNISVGATLTFSNPAPGGTLIILKSQGNVTIAGTLNASAMGANPGGTGGVWTSGAGTNGISGTNASQLFDSLTTHKGGGGSASNTGPAGIAGTQYTFPYFYNTQNYKWILMAPGSSGGGAGSGNANSTNTGGNGGNGGIGGGSVYMECAGTYSATGTINTSGQDGANGTNGTGGGGVSGGGGGGGGGAAGDFYCLYNAIGTDSATYTISGGNQGTGGGGFSGAGGAGGGGGGNADNVGIAGNASGTPTGGNGGNGGNGVAIREQNVTWA